MLSPQRDWKWNINPAKIEQQKPKQGEIFPKVFPLTAFFQTGTIDLS
ncbi:hypothetical protein C789_366 [Microcystis aeruginosa FACHB-905 = DIANCHI905]|uniref:Uncharacterized protein n=1 Tax=Microcystis aeruginosa PCC 7806SL TaxID=1903187 RepID=A0AB33BJ28_MICA7|nr:hypothetical protein BH695_1734 [Microcystis aeruginosa PCC 7806SL]ELS49840.1 hypothetical protein C789_366 [Microcystis aeruginosa FACHB-905 = DIANCHI905]